MYSEEDTAFRLGAASKTLTLIGAGLILTPTPFTSILGVGVMFLGAVCGIFSWMVGSFADVQRKKLMAQYNEVIEKIQKEQKQVVERMHDIIKENNKNLEKISNTLKDMKVDVEHIEDNIKNMTKYLTHYVNKAVEVTKSTMVFMEYRIKRDELDVLQELLICMITIPSSNAINDFLFSCRTRRPLLILNWIYRRVVSGKIEPSLMPSIVNYVDHNWVQFKTWKQIILLDAVKAVLFQHLCQKTLGKRIPDFLHKKDLKYGKQKLHEIEQHLNYYEEISLYKAFYNTTDTIKKKLM